jgi:GNAT superfamily N-acetyltransferase
MLIRKATAGELSWVNERYAEIGFMASDPRDLVVIAEVDGVRVGLGRLVPFEPGAAELGGIYVLPEFRGRHVASLIVSHLVGAGTFERLYCIPFAPLVPFYQSFGFHPVEASPPVPEAIAEKVRWCQSKYSQPVSLLVRSPARARLL